jgi:hypothetical protein
MAAKRDLRYKKIRDSETCFAIQKIHGTEKCFAIQKIHGSEIGPVFYTSG